MKRQNPYFSEHFDEAVAWRRDLHRHPQPTWLEFYSTGYIAEKLSGWGYEVLLGKQIISANTRLSVPSENVLDQEYRRAIDDGIKEEWVKPARGGLTGAVGILVGKQPGPTIAFRFDIDCNLVQESNDTSRKAVAEGYVSQYPGYAHMCGHDAHTAMGLLLAKYFADNRDKVKGTIKIVFQPNEENLSGAAPMIAQGVADDIDILLGGHIGVALRETGKIALNVHSSLAINRSAVEFRGKASHAGLRPDLGKDAILGASAAILNLHAIPRHGLGVSRINVGQIHGGTTWNVIPDKAYFQVETRASSNEISDYMGESVQNILEGTAKMYGLGLTVTSAGSCPTGLNSSELIEAGTKVARNLSSVEEVLPELAWGGTDDFMLMGNYIQERGGKSMYIQIGTPVGGGHHSNSFEIDETVMGNGAEFFAALYEFLISTVK